MTADKLADAILNKCDIYYGGALISKEAIIEKYLAFFAKSLVSKERTINFALHTGSVCFDVISVVAVALGCLSYNLSTNDDIISSLQPNDMVLFKGQRYRWKGTGFEYGSLCMILQQDGKGKNGKTTSYLPLDRNKHLIKPYYGDSQVTDGRGVKKRSTNREDFLSYIFDVDVVEIPTQIDVSVVIVAERNSFGEICKQVRIAYGDGKAVSLLDIIPAAYYTGSGDEYQYGLNPTKAEPVLKVTGKISTARDLVLDNHGNKVVGLLVTGGISLSENNSELADLLRRKLLRFVHVISPLKADIGERILEIYDEASVFACTKELLSQNSQMIRSENPLTMELHRQIMNVIHNTVTPIVVSGGWEWTEYRRIKSAILTIRQSNWQDSEKDDFVITAYGLLNLMNTALFSMEEMEKAIDERRIHQAVLPPQEQIARLWDIAERAGSLQDLCITVADALEQKYKERLIESPKADFVDKYIKAHGNDKIAIVVPKAYYSDILRFIHPDYFRDDHVICVTANRFDFHGEYDAILCVGEINSRRFDPLQCSSVRNIDVLLIDDIQFIIGKESTQEEFFHTFNSLYQDGKQIVISSDKPPKEMETLSERLRTRFEMGLPVDIQIPTYETKMAIINRKAEISGLDIPYEVSDYVATHIKSSIRELEGALTKLSAFSKLSHTPITVEFAEQTLKDLISPDAKKEITPELIIQTVADHFNVKYDDLLSSKRTADIVHPRQIAMYLCRQMTTAPLQAVGKALGNRDHTTVIHGAEKIAQEVVKNDSMRNTIDIIIKKINPS